MSAKTLHALSALIALIAVVVRAEPVDRSKMLTHPVNVVGPAENVHGSSQAAVDRSRMLTHPVNVVGPVENVHGSSQASKAVEVRLPQEGGVQAATLALGQKMVVAIAGNPSTGYQWELAGRVDGAVLEQEGRVEFVAGVQELVGAPGEYQFVYKAMGPGTTAVRLKYVRPWEKDKPPVAIATVNVTVTK